MLAFLNKRTFCSSLQLESRLYFVENDTKYSDVAPLIITEHFSMSCHGLFIEQCIEIDKLVKQKTDNDIKKIPTVQGAVPIGKKALRNTLPMA